MMLRGARCLSTVIDYRRGVTKGTTEPILRRARCCQNRDDHEARDEDRSLDYDVKERNDVALQNVARGTWQRRDRAASSATTAVQLAPWVPASRFEVASSFGRHCSSLRGRRLILLQPVWDGALRVICFVRLLAKEAPKRWPGTRKAGSGSVGA